MVEEKTPDEEDEEEIAEKEGEVEEEQEEDEEGVAKTSSPFQEVPSGCTTLMEGSRATRESEDASRLRGSCESSSG